MYTINYTKYTKLEKYSTQSNFYVFCQAIPKITLISVSKGEHNLVGLQMGYHTQIVLEALMESGDIEMGVGLSDVELLK